MGQVGSGIYGEAEYDFSGWSVDITASGNRVAIGAPGNDDGGDEAGHVRVFEWDGNVMAWNQVGEDIDGEAGGDNSGTSIALSADGTLLAAGAPFNSAGGHVRIYTFEYGAWSQVGSDIDGETADDGSGFYVALSGNGNRVAIGAPYNDGSNPNAGHTRVYELNAGIWEQVGSDIDGVATEDNAGRSVALNADGSRVAIGAPYRDIPGTPDVLSNVGDVRVFDYLEILPVELTRFDAIADGHTAILTWETSCETTNRGFEVQIQLEETHWQTLGFVPGNGTTNSASNYSYMAIDLSQGIHNFRLKQVDLNGRSRFSETIELAIGIEGGGFLGPVYPNPIQSRGSLRIKAPSTGYVEVYLFDMLGRRMQRLYAGEMTGGNVETLVLAAEELPPGQYFVCFESRGRSIVRPVVVAR